MNKSCSLHPENLDVVRFTEATHDMTSLPPFGTPTSSHHFLLSCILIILFPVCWNIINIPVRIL